MQESGDNLRRDSDVGCEYIERLRKVCCSGVAAGREARGLFWMLKGVSSERNTKGDKIDDAIADPVNHPDHYTAGGIEVIDIIEAKGLGPHLSNVLKYILRVNVKYPRKWQEDIEKAIWYLERYIRFRDRGAYLMYLEKRYADIGAKLAERNEEAESDTTGSDG